MILLVFSCCGSYASYFFQDDLQLLAGVEDNSDSDIEDHDNDLDAEPVRKDEVSLHVP